MLCGGEGVVGRRSSRGNVAHFTSGTGGFLSIEVETNPRLAQHALERRISVLPEIAEEVDDRCGAKDGGVAERKVADRSNELLELARRTRCFGLVKGVVRSRSQLVHQ